MSLDEFKTIFWWEWSHRLLGRVIGVAYLLPFLWFLWRGVLSADLKRRLWIIFGLGALQGAVGWWMVASGLSQRVEVSQFRLATHLVLALLIYAAIVWTLRRLRERPPVAAAPRLKITALVLLALTFVQLYLGALVAGLRAGRVYNTWPEIDGALDSLRGAAVLRAAVVAQPVRQYADRAVRASHGRLCAVRAGGLACARRGPLACRDRRHQRRGVARGGITLQAALGIQTLLHQVPMLLALAHQAVAIVVLTLAILQVERLAPRRSRERPDRIAEDLGLCASRVQARLKP